MNADRLTVDPAHIWHPPRGLIYYAFCIVIPIQIVYVFGFNHMPDSVRLGIAALLFGVHLVLAAFTLMSRPRGWNLLLLLSVALTMVTWIPAHMLGLGEVDSVGLGDLMRSIAWPLMLIWVLAYPLSLPRSLLVWTTVILTIAGAAIALTGTPVYVSGTPRLASLTSGTDNMHASAKVVALQVIMLDQLRRAGLLDFKLAWPLIILACLILVGFEGRNELVFVAVYYGVMVYSALRRDLVIRMAPYVGIGLGLVLAVIVLQVVHDPGGLGSGRVGVWSYRIWLLAHRPPITFLFGGGIGADMIWTPQWWFFKEGAAAHNDYLQAMMESGVIGVLCMFILLYACWLRLPDNGRAIVIAIGANSFFANGFFSSPLLALSLSLAMTVSMMGALMRDAAAAGTVQVRRRDELGIGSPDPVPGE